MPLTSGARVGAYEVTSAIGAGGMGEVFRARDTRLKRDVALKVLPQASPANSELRQRFEREAQLLAALDHHNIARVFGVEDSDGSPVIVMEFVEGPTLAQRLALGPLPIDETVAIALEICRGLEAAHDTGIVHRDLKPANIKIRPDGVVKILDFGLALASEERIAAVANAPTMVGMRTEPGVILGTAAYMSPEQARGQVVDARADIWAFGCVLYEMLAGLPAFPGATTTDILAAVIQAEPDWTKLPADLPARVSELLRRCLQKPLKARQRAIGDAAFQLQRVLEAGASSDARVQPTAVARRQRGRWRAWAVPALVCAASAGLIFVWLEAGSESSEVAVARAAIRASVSLPPATTLSLSRGSAVALSPDGTRLVFAGRSGDEVRLYQRALDRFESEAIPGTEGASNQFFSPDGRWVGFFADGKLKKVSLQGGAPVSVTDAPNPRGEAWGEADTILLTPRNSTGVSRVSAAGGASSPFTTLEAGELSHRWPRFLPGGAGVLFTVWNDTGWEPARIVGQRLDGSGRTVVVERSGGYGRYVRDGANARGYLVYARAEGLMAAAFDESTLEVTSGGVPVIDGIITNLSGGAHFDISSNGILAYVPGALAETDRRLQWVSLDGTAGPPLQTSRLSTLDWRLSPDGRRLMHSSTAGTTRELWIDDLERGTRVRLPQGSDSFAPVWSGDGSWVTFIKGAQGSVVRTLAQPGAKEEMLLPNEGRPAPNSVSPDGRWLAYSVINKESQRDIWMLPLPTGALGSGSAPGVARPFVTSPAAEGDARFSPDGRWVVYQANTTGRFEVYVRPFPDGDREYQISPAGGLDPDWSRSGQEIYYRGPDNAVMAAPFVPSATAMPIPRRLFDGSPYDNPLAVSADGRRLLMMPRLAAETAATEIRLVANFLDELRARVR